jgi:fermentation-respiration switch protein FrsA (DUF1100 family)
MRDSHSPAAAIGKIAPVPVLLIHGTADRVVPYHHADTLHAAARAPRELWTIKNGRHTSALGPDRAQVVPKLLTRFEQWLAIAE